MLEINQSTFTHNTATGVDECDDGGALCVRDGYVNIDTSNFEHNRAWEDAIGGVMEIDRSNISLSNSNFTHNTASRSGGVVECEYIL